MTIDLSTLSIETLIEEIDKRLNVYKSKTASLKKAHTNKPFLFKSFPGYILCVQSTYMIIKANDSPSGLQVKDIMAIYLQSGIDTHDRLINEHLAVLITEDKIFQMNPENTRGRRFRAIENIK